MGYRGHREETGVTGGHKGHKGETGGHRRYRVTQRKQGEREGTTYPLYTSILRINIFI